MADGTRTHDDWNHNPGLYRLSCGHHREASDFISFTPTSQSFATSFAAVTTCSTQGFGAAGGTRTPDLRLRRPLLYPAELLPHRDRKSQRNSHPVKKHDIRSGAILYCAVTGCLSELPVCGRGERIRTSDILLPKQARYRAALRPEKAAFYAHLRFRSNSLKQCPPRYFSLQRAPI